ncbi:MAG TPA: hypothetical protein VFU81_10085, partial [Thermomicrobiales bacterium]|nr:hypothetical protein [Thermomicrobiales bacterium]
MANPSPQTGRFSRRRMLRGVAGAALATGAAAARHAATRAATPPTAAATPAANPATGDWPAYGRDPGGMRHSPLTQINR